MSEQARPAITDDMLSRMDFDYEYVKGRLEAVDPDLFIFDRFLRSVLATMVAARAALDVDDITHTHSTAMQVELALNKLHEALQGNQGEQPKE